MKRLPGDEENFTPLRRRALAWLVFSSNDPPPFRARRDYNRMLSASLLRSLTLAGLSGLLVTASFPRPGLAFCAWFALVPLFFALLKTSTLRAFAIGWFAGFTCYVTALSWLTNVARTYLGTSSTTADLILLIFSGLLSLYTGVLASCLVPAMDKPLHFLVLATPLWVAMEWIRSSVPFGFPWAIGYSLYCQPALIQLAEFSGVYGISALVVFANVTLFLLLWCGTSAPAVRAGGIVLCLALALILPWSASRRAAVRALSTESRPIGLVQGNVTPEERSSPSAADDVLARYLDLTALNARQGARLSIWPETAIPFVFEVDETFRDRLLDHAQRIHSGILFGGQGIDADRGTVRAYNRAYLISATGAVEGHYDKIKLVPFAESHLGTGVHAPLGQDLSAGSVSKVFDVEGTRLGVIICYEAIFPDLARRLARNGAAVLANITNDVWLGQTSGPYQHLAFSVFRAVENRIPVVRVANTGLSAVIDPDGSIRAETQLDTIAAEVVDVRWPRIQTVYKEFGDVFAIVCAGFAAGWLIVYWVGSMRRSEQQGALHSPFRM